jgi:Mg-chelatase subunit ChlD
VIVRAPHTAVLTRTTLILGVVCVMGCRVPDSSSSPPPAEAAPSVSREVTRIITAITPSAVVVPREGLAAAIVIDVSGSMKRNVGGRNSESKIVVARRAAIDLVDQFAKYAEAHPGEPVLLGIYEFSSRNNEPDCREVIAMAPPDRARAQAAIASMKADGGTPIGSAMIQAKRMLDGTGLNRRHLMVVTDGENTDGFDPDDVAVAINHRPEVERPSIYFVAFDTDASRFNGVRNAGGLVLAAASGPELVKTIDSLLSGKILIEK